MMIMPIKCQPLIPSGLSDTKLLIYSNLDHYLILSLSPQISLVKLCLTGMERERERERERESKMEKEWRGREVAHNFLEGA